MDPDATAPNGTTTAADSTAPIAQQVIGRYEVVRLLGRGGMGEVYLAHDPVLDRRVAVKLIGHELDDQEARQRLVHEARAAGRLRHPNIVTIFDAGEHAGAPYIAMEHVEGETLRSLIRRRAPVPLARRLELIASACAGLAHAHRANVVHFDVKPDNLMLDADGVLKVLDFGIARVLKSEVLVTQHVVGTLRYMSPEQAGGSPLDRRSDVFSLGSSLFELVAYSPAYAGSAHEIITRITGGPVPRLAEVVPAVDARLDALVARAMALDPARRFDDLDELAEELGRLRRELEPDDGPRRSAVAVSVAAMSVTGTAPATPTRRTRPAVLAGVGASTLAIGLGATWVLTLPPRANDRISASLVAAKTPAGPAAPAPPIVAPPGPDATPIGVAGTRAAPGNAAPATASGDRAAVAERQVSAPAPPSPTQRTTPDVGGTRSVQPVPAAPVDTPRPEPAAAVAPPEPAGAKPSAAPPEPAGARPAAPPPVSPAQVQAPDEANAVLAAVRRYHDAYTALDAAAVRQMYPTLAADQVEQLRRSFGAISAYEVDAREPRVEVRTDTATVRAVVVRRIAPRVGRPVTNEVETEFRLRRDPRGWVITDVKATR